MMNELQDGDGGVDLGGVYGRWCGLYEGILCILYVREKKIINQ